MRSFDSQPQFLHTSGMVKSSPSQLARVKQWQKDNPDKVRRYRKRWRQKTKDVRNAKHRDYMKSWRLSAKAKAVRLQFLLRLRRFIQDQKTLCELCGETDKSLLDFHHIDPKTKTRTVSGCTSFASARREIAKCSVLCKTCHLTIHGKSQRPKHRCPHCHKEIN